MRGFISIISILTSLCALSSAQAQVNSPALHARAKLVQYAVEFEARHPVEASWSKKVSWLDSFAPSAEAYANGESCLILGFESTFQDNLCKLSTAEGAAAYQSSCAAGSFPCNPAVFGQADAAHVFCAPASAGNQLSKSCAFQTFQYLDEKSNHAIPDFDKLTLQNFDASKLDLTTGKTALLSASKTLFSSPDASLDKAFDFTGKLCQDISAGKKTGNQPQDLKTCKMYLGFLSQAKVGSAVASSAGAGANRSPAVVSVDTTLPARRPASPSAASVSATVTPTATPTPSPTAAPSVSTNNAGCASCALNAHPPVLPEQTHNQLQRMVSSLQTSSDAAQWNACLQSLEAQPEIPAGKKGVYWKQINGQKTFAMQCGRGNDTSTSLNFAFMTDSGYQKVVFPRVRYTTYVTVAGVRSVEHPQVPDQIVSFKSGGTQYYANIQFSDSFGLVSGPELASRAQDDLGMTSAKAKSRAAFYASTLQDQHLSSDFNLTPADPTNSDDAWVKSCVQDRAVDFLNNLLSPTYNSSAPSDTQIRADWNLSTQSPEFQARYSPSLNDWSETLRAKLMTRLPACAQVVDSALFYKAFDRAFLGSPAVVQNYNSLHNRISH